MASYVTDTHALIWYLENDPRLGPNARIAFDSCDQGEAVIYIPTICLVEIVYLMEKGRIPSKMVTLLEEELRAGTTGFMLADLTLDVAKAVGAVIRGDIPDLPDRIIAATALSLKVPLITRDKKIRLSGLKTIW
ncbi:MAG: type II toxin-antitoxin system VapC family toxin [Chloroflexota bacterium]